MSKRIAVVLVVIAVSAAGVVFYAKEWRSRPAAQHAVLTEQVAHKKIESHEKKRPDTRHGNRTGKKQYSQREYALLRQRYKPTGVVANGPMPKQNLKRTAKSVKDMLLQHKMWPIVKNVLYGKTSAVENALDTGLSPNATVFLAMPYKANVSLLDLAIMTGQRSVIRLLLSHDASVNPPDIGELYGQPAKLMAPLPTAAQYGEDDVIRLLLRRGANIEQESNNYRNHVTALAAAVDTWNVSTAYLLLTHGANVNSALRPNGTVPDVLVEDSDDPSAVALRKLLIEYGATMPSGQ